MGNKKKILKALKERSSDADLPKIHIINPIPHTDDRREDGESRIQQKKWRQTEYMRATDIKKRRRFIVEIQ